MMTTPTPAAPGKPEEQQEQARARLRSLLSPNLTARTIQRQQAGQIGRNSELEAEAEKCGGCQQMKRATSHPEAVCPVHYLKFRQWRESECERLDREDVPWLLSRLLSLERERDAAQAEAKALREAVNHTMPLLQSMAGEVFGCGKVPSAEECLEWFRAALAAPAPELE